MTSSNKIDRAIKNMPHILSVPTITAENNSNPILNHVPPNPFYSTMSYNNFFDPSNNPQIYNSNPGFGQTMPNQQFGPNPPQMNYNMPPPFYGMAPPPNYYNPYYPNYPQQVPYPPPQQTLPTNNQNSEPFQQSFVMQNATFQNDIPNASEFYNNESGLKLGQHAQEESSSIEFVKLPDTMTQNSQQRKQEKNEKIKNGDLFINNIDENEENEEDASSEEENLTDKQYALEESISESEFDDQVPIQVVSPHDAAQKEIDIAQEKQQIIIAKVAQKNADDNYRKLGRKQYDINQMIFNSDLVKEQKRQTEEFMHNALEYQINKLDQKSEQLLFDINEADKEIAEINLEAASMNKEVEKLRFEKRANKIIQDLRKAEGWEEKDVDELRQSMSQSQVNQNLQNLHEGNEKIFMEVSRLLKQMNPIFMNNESDDYDSLLIQSIRQSGILDSVVNSRSRVIENDKKIKTSLDSQKNPYLSTIKQVPVKALTEKDLKRKINSTKKDPISNEKNKTQTNKQPSQSTNQDVNKLRNVRK